MFVHQMSARASAAFQSPTLKPAARRRATDTFGPGRVCRYHCQIHGTMMSGQVVVAPRAPTADRAVARTTIHPSVATVAPGGTVSWTQRARHPRPHRLRRRWRRADLLPERTRLCRQHADDRGDAGSGCAGTCSTWTSAARGTTSIRIPRAGSCPPAGRRLRRARLSPVESFVADTEVPPPSGSPASSTSCSATPPKMPAGSAEGRLPVPLPHRGAHDGRPRRAGQGT